MQTKDTGQQVRDGQRVTSVILRALYNMAPWSCTQYSVALTLKGPLLRPGPLCCSEKINIILVGATLEEEPEKRTYSLFGK